MPNPTPNCPWPSSIDDLRAEPGRLVFESDLLRLRIITHHGMIKRLPKPLQVPAEPNGWEARTILDALGIHLGGPSELGPSSSRKSKAAIWSPGDPHPRHADRRTLAAIITDEVGPVSPRSLEKWPLIGQQFNGRKIFSVEVALKVARDRLAMSVPRKTA
jgi:hypothetical protein